MLHQTSLKNLRYTGNEMEVTKVLWAGPRWTTQSLKGGGGLNPQRLLGLRRKDGREILIAAL